VFTEPNLAFRMRSRCLEVNFSHESLPPWLPGPGATAAVDASLVGGFLSRVFPVRLDVPAGELARPRINGPARSGGSEARRVTGLAQRGW
jgi:hypothetical protein